ncbi:hypothetical protein ACFQ46_04560 [Kineococcus sp. GCM10028916]|uniref:hypothetical protein n=1 Tax=Kineococcus sp. GCM10028916 TaxID=3273394 RepID=UPI00362F9516
MRKLLAVVALVGCLTGCSTSEGRACTLMGGSSGVAFDLNGLPLTDPTSVRACVGEVCTEAQVGVGSGFVGVDDETLTKEGTVDVSLRVADAVGSVVFDATGTATLHRVDVNGNGCGPIVYRADVVAGTDGTLTAG